MSGLLRRLTRYAAVFGAIVFVAVIARMLVFERSILESRIKSQIHQEAPKVAVSHVNRGIGAYDPPAVVFEVLWGMAVAKTSTDVERRTAQLALAEFATRSNPLRIGTWYNENDWDRAFNEMLQRQHHVVEGGDKTNEAFLAAIEKLRVAPVIIRGSGKET